MSRMECGPILGAKRRSKWFCAEQNLLCTDDADDVMRVQAFQISASRHRIIHSLLCFCNSWFNFALTVRLAKLSGSCLLREACKSIFQTKDVFVIFSPLTNEAKPNFSNAPLGFKSSFLTWLFDRRPLRYLLLLSIVIYCYLLLLSIIIAAGLHQSI